VTDMVQEMIPNSMMIGCLAGHVDAGLTAHVLKLLALLTIMTVFVCQLCLNYLLCVQFAVQFCIGVV